MVKLKSRKLKKTCCSHPHLIIDSEQRGVCKNCGKIKSFPTNQQIEETITSLAHRNYIIELGIPDRVLQEIEKVFPSVSK